MNMEKMYRVPRIIDLPSSLPVPTCMYAVDRLCSLPDDLSSSYYEDNRCGENGESNPELHELETCQKNIIEKLQELKAKLESLQNSQGLMGSNALSGPGLLEQFQTSFEARKSALLGIVSEAKKVLQDAELEQDENVSQMAECHHHLVRRLKNVQLHVEEFAAGDCQTELQQEGSLQEKQQVLLDVIDGIRNQLLRVRELLSDCQETEELDVHSSHELAIQLIKRLQQTLTSIVHEISCREVQECFGIKSAASQEPREHVYGKSSLEVMASVGQDASSPSVTEESGHLSTLAGAADASSRGVPHDLVISANPNSPPYSVILLRKWLNQAGVSVFCQSHVHSSVSHVDPQLCSLFQECPLEKRTLHFLGFTVQWKSVTQTTLMVNPLKQGAVLGEANIVRYISRLLPSASPYCYENCGTFSSVSEVDCLLDDLQALLQETNNKSIHAALNCLNSRLSKCKWLLESKSIVDALGWSVLLQKGLASCLPANITTWFQRLSQEAGLDKDALDSLVMAPSGEPDVATSIVTCTSNKTKEDLINFLKSRDMSYQLREHPEVFTVEALMSHVSDMPGLHMKNLFLRDKKKKYFLLSTSHDKKVELNELAKQIGTKDMRFGDEGILYEMLGVKQGCVTPFALLNDSKNQVTLVLDSEALNDKHPFVNFHPLVNDATLGLSPACLRTFLDVIHHSPVVVNL